MTFATPLATAGTLLAAAGSIYSGYSAMQQANTQAKFDQYNAAIADQNATRAIEVAQINQQTSDNEAAALIGEQLAAQSASGLTLNSRSAILARKGQAELNRKDALNIRQAGELQRFNYESEAASLRAQAKASRASGRSAFIASLFNAGGTLIGSAKPTAKTVAKFAPVPVPRPSSLAAPGLYSGRR